MYEYIGALAPKGQEGLFLGYANLPVAIGSLTGGPVGAFIFNEVMAKGAVTRPDGLLELNPNSNALGWIILMAIGLALGAGAVAVQPLARETPRARGGGHPAVEVLGQVLDLLVLLVGVPGGHVPDRDDADEPPLAGDGHVANPLLAHDRLDLVDLAVGLDEDHFGGHHVANHRARGIALLGDDPLHDVPLREDADVLLAVEDEERADVPLQKDAARVPDGAGRRDVDDAAALLPGQEVGCRGHDRNMRRPLRDRVKGFRGFLPMRRTTVAVRWFGIGIERS